ncbi:conserved exported hypothetical protein [Verrucomicrobia bacterium]|nr:conserved exported hypothetical protein [Verrucomicrobiota bacterium]
MKSSIAILLLFWSSLWFGSKGLAQTGTNVVVSFSTTNATPINLGFAGFTTELLGKGEEYGDTNLQRYAAMLSPGWLLFPAGTTGDAFNWTTGLTDTNWVNMVGLFSGPNNPASNLCAGTAQALLGKGGVWFTNFATLAENVGGAKIIVCINGFTDTNTSAGAFAAYALSNHIHVAAWELCNEPYLFQGTNYFFTNGTDYANKMKPYRDAIKAADSNAIVAVFFSDPGRPSMVWDNQLAGYSNQWWDAVVYHYYPQFPSNVSFAHLMAMDNGILFSNSSLFVTNVLMAETTNNPNNPTFLLTEFAPGDATSNGSESPPTSSLYGGIYAAEMVMRLSTCPRMSFAGSYQLLDGAGVDTTNDFWNAVTKAASGHYVTNTVGLPFGYFLSAQGSAEAVAYWAINRSTAVYGTSVSTNGPTVPMDTNGVGTMPAIFALAYQGGNGKRYVVVTNKGSNAVPVQILQDGAALTNQFLETFVTGSDPSVVNVNPPSNNIVMQSLSGSNPVVIPEYSVVRLEWVTLSVPEPILGVSARNGIQNIRWAGLTNVIYNVESVTNLRGRWTTLGRVTGGQTNFSFTNWNACPQQFYRLAVP